jgi:Flp pilus assembly protein TadB
MARKQDIHTITTAAPGHTADVNARTKRYLVMMGIRIVCFILAVVVSGWPRWMFIVGAIILPYLAVVVANARDERHQANHELEFPGASGLLELPPSPNSAEK